MVFQWNFKGNPLWIQLKFQWISNGNFNEMQMLPIWNSVEISSNYQWKSFRNKSSRNSNRNLNEVPYEISIIYQWKSIKDPVEMWMKIPMEINKKSSWNLKEIQMKYLWKSIGNPVGISVNGRTDGRTSADLVRTGFPIVKSCF